MDKAVHPKSDKRHRQNAIDHRLCNRHPLPVIISMQYLHNSKFMCPQQGHDAEVSRDQ